ncbi:hypothetical protein [Streptomyces sp. NPDC058476]|uniref:hypothetical protein n=1 Tax=unclassified Streptomyces TaxID=2593676 RepID=UPI0036692E81
MPRTDPTRVDLTRNPEPSGHELKATKMNMFTRLVTAALATATLAFSSGGQAFASPEETQATQGFHIYNFTGHSIRFSKVSGVDDFHGRPPVGKVLEPGRDDDFELAYSFTGLNTAFLTYDMLDAEGATVGRMTFALTVDGLNRASSQCHVNDGPFSCGGNAKQLYALDSQGTVHDVAADDTEQSQNILNTLCGDGNPATCKFDVKTREKVLEPGKVYGRPVANNTDDKDSFDVTATDTVTSQDLVEIGLRVGAKLTEVVNAEVSARYSHTWTTAHTFTQTLHVTVDPHREAWIEETIPAIRYTGDVMVTLGNTQWNLHGVHFDAPDADGGLQAVYSIKDRPLTAQQRQDLPEAVSRLNSV